MVLFDPGWSQGALESRSTARRQGLGLHIQGPTFGVHSNRGGTPNMLRDINKLTRGVSVLITSPTAPRRIVSCLEPGHMHHIPYLLPRRA